MLLNALEFTMMNNPVWWAMQRRLIEQRWATQRNLIPLNARALEIGCGSGHGALAITELFSLQEIYAVDLDERMVERAKKHESAKMHFEVGDASRMRFPDSTFDAVFDSGVMHHIPNWRNSLQECYRVLKPDGKLFMMDFSIETFNTLLGRIIKPVFEHPYTRMYRRQELINALSQYSFETVVYTQHHIRVLSNFTLVAKKLPNKASNI